MFIATETTTIKLPLSDEAIEFATRYCGFYENANYTIDTESVVITETRTTDPTDSIFWPGNGIKF